MTSNKKKVYAGLVIVGFVALVGDRLLTSTTTPAPAAAANGGPVTPPVTRGGSDGGSNTPGGPAGSVTAAAFPRKLPAATPTPDANAALRDAFGLTPAAHLALRGPAADPAANKDGTHPADALQHGMTAAQFTDSHRLTAVMQGPEIAIAVVDDQWIQLGQSIDGCTLVEITGRNASFRCGDALAELSVEIAGQPTAR